jgi:hypothetical protein
MKAAAVTQSAFGMIKAHCSVTIPKDNQRLKLKVVRAYIRIERPSVSRVEMIFQTCGRKLQTEAVAAQKPRICTASNFTSKYAESTGVESRSG